MGVHKRSMIQKNNQEQATAHATIDGNEALVYGAYRASEVIAIYPITPSSPMGELADEWAAKRIPNIWGAIPHVMEMQSEGGAAGAVHGALQAGSLTTTFTASQGLLLMIPNMYKIAGELTSAVIHVAARTLATHALSIFCDHGDVMATRSTGFALLAAASVQEGMDLAVIAHAATLRARVPFLHFIDGFRTSHEVAKIELLPEQVIRAMIDDELVAEHRRRALSPDHPVLRGTAQNPDVFFQARERANPYYIACPDITQDAMDAFAKLTGRQYRLFEYHGAEDAERVVVLMGSGCETAHETVNHLNAQGEKVGLLKVRLYRPFDVKRFVDALPKTVKSIAVLDRTKEPGSTGEPLYLDCVDALYEAGGVGAGMPKVIGGRYGLSSKEFTPAMVKAVFENLAKDHPKKHFSVGIHDDMGHTSLDFDPGFSIEGEDRVRAIFYGLGSDGTVGANKNSIKIIGENTPNFAQGYFVYDSKKAGAVTISHLRFGPELIRSPYLVSQANFVACHQTSFLERYDMLRPLVEGGVFFLNTPYGPDEVWDHLPREVQTDLIEKKARFYVIDAEEIAQKSGMGRRINTIMQACFFNISGVLPEKEAMDAIKSAIKKTYGKKGDEIVQKNLTAVDHAVGGLFEVTVPDKASAEATRPPIVPEEAPDYVKDVLGKMIEGFGDELPVSSFSPDGTFPTATTKWEKRNIALEIPIWEPDLCIQCCKCSFVCPHAVIRAKVYEPDALKGAPEGFRSADARDKDWKGMKFTIQVAAEDCTGCETCVGVCPAKDKSNPDRKAINMVPQPQVRETECANWEFFLNIPEHDRSKIKTSVIRQQQVQQPLFEFSGACAGCGETAYVKLLSQLFGDRLMVSNATGCSSIYGGNLPTTPWAKNNAGLGPSWSNSLFEDNAEFGFGMRLAVDQQKAYASRLLKGLASQVGDEMVKAILETSQKDEAQIHQVREHVAVLKKKLAGVDTAEAKQLLIVADALVKKSVWIVGGDGWAYDIGFGGLDHVMACGRNVNILVLDTEVYSNTGGQMSKATPIGAVAKFAANGKRAPKKDMGLIAMSYGTVYVGSVAMGAQDSHTLKTFIEAEKYEGTSIIMAYSHCIAHGIDMRQGLSQQKAAVNSGQWILYRYDPQRAERGENALQVDSRAIKKPLDEYMYNENRFKMLKKAKPEVAAELLKKAEKRVDVRWKMYQHLAKDMTEQEQ